MPSIDCPSCHQPIQDHQAAAGQVFACPHCQQSFTVPVSTPPPDVTPNPLSNLNDDPPPSGRRRRQHERGGPSVRWFAAKVTAGVLALLIVCGLVWGGWYRFYYYPPMHDLECSYSTWCDACVEAQAEYERDMAAEKTENVNTFIKYHSKLAIYTDELDRVCEEFRTKYGRNPRYLKPSERY